MERDIKKKAQVYGFTAVICAIMLGAVCYNLGPSPQPFQPEYNFNIMILPQQFGREVFAGVVKEARILEANAPQYELPLDLGKVKNIKTILDEFNLDDTSLQLLKENGFVVISWSKRDQFDESYNLIDQLGVPIFITTDSMLHVYHVFFDEILRSIEEKYFIQDLTEAVNDLVEKSISLYYSIPAENETLKEASKRNVCFFCVAAKLLDPTFTVPDFASDLVNEEITLIEAHDGMYNSPLFRYEDYRIPGGDTTEDYSQYVPRGHYTRSELLKRYFKAMMWFGRMRFMAKSKFHTVQALLVTSTLNQLAEAKAIWERIYVTTAFFVGYSDDLTVYDYEEVIKEVYGPEFNVMDLEDEAKLARVQDKLIEMNHAKIVSSPIYPWQREELIGLRFMGQRFIPDSYMFQELVYDKVGFWRLMPKGLDVMAVLGSERAEEHLSSDIAHPDYAEQLNKLKDEFSELTVTNWTQNLYWSWLYSINSTLRETPEGYPTFMTKPAWLDEKLNTALGSWTELRHDTILYAKQSYTIKGIAPTPPPGYVEPLPQLYTKLSGLCNMTINGLKALGLLDGLYEEKLLEFQSLLTNLTDISIKELNGETISEAQIEFIKTIGHQLSQIMEAFTDEAKRSILIADVHTDPNPPERVLEEGCGYIDLIIVVYKSPDGRLIATAGPTFSYYEFQQPVSQRLTDEAWIEILNTGIVPPRPDWISSFHP